MLRIDNLTAGYGRIEVLHGISLTLGAGQLVCLLGANGAGKTTTLNCISGVIGATSGSIEFDGQRLNGLAPDRIVARGIVQLPEGRAVFGSMSVRDNLELGTWCRRDRAAALRDLDHGLTLFPILRQRLKQAAGTLSGGEQQMLMLARALAAGPKLLLLDEPSLGLSPVAVENMFGVIVRLRGAGIPILLVEQNARAALDVSDAGYVLQNGEIVAQGSAAELRDNDFVREAYLG
ncbi:MAG TPA: ABC transporter ATP-binding protein [Stellaceae bacterium]